MNVELIKSKMEAFFAKTTSQEIISDFEEMGYTFVDIDFEWVEIPTYTTCVSVSHMQSETFLEKIQFWNRKKNNEICLTSDYLGSFFV
jgi:hypothetical protein